MAPKKLKSILVSEQNNSSGYEHSIPTVLLFRRQSIRTYPNNQRVALYYCAGLGKYLTVPYSATNSDIGILDAQLSETISETISEGSQTLRALSNIQSNNDGKTGALLNVKGGTTHVLKGIANSGHSDATKIGMAIGTLARKAINTVRGIPVTNPEEHPDARSPEKPAGSSFGQARIRKIPAQQRVANAFAPLPPVKTGAEKSPAGNGVTDKADLSKNAEIDAKNHNISGAGLEPAPQLKKTKKNYGSDLDQGIPFEESFRSKLKAKRLKEDMADYIPGMETNDQFKKRVMDTTSKSAGQQALDFGKTAAKTTAAYFAGRGAIGLAAKAAPAIGAGIARVRAALTGPAAQTAGAAYLGSKLAGGSKSSSDDSSDPAKLGDYENTPSAAKPQGRGITSKLSRPTSVITTAIQNRQNQQSVGINPYKKSSLNETNNFEIIQALVENKIEPTEISFSEGKETIKLNRTMARRILNLHETLNKENKKKLKTMLNESAGSFRRVVNFTVRNIEYGSR